MIYIPSTNSSNLSSVKRYLDVKGRAYKLLKKDDSLTTGRDVILLPGVGTFQSGMNSLNLMDLVGTIKEFGFKGGQIIGICLGMQLLLESSEESPGIEGLGLIKGRVKGLPFSSTERVPRVGWDELLVSSHSKIFPKNDFFIQAENLDLVKSLHDYYFVHSYYCDVSNPEIVSAWFRHGEQLYCGSIKADNIFGLQFHPEKSGEAGYLLLDSILDQV